MTNGRIRLVYTQTESPIMHPISLIITLAVAASLQAITHTYTLGGERRWDYVVADPANHRVFIERETRVMMCARFAEVPSRAKGRAPVSPGTFRLMVMEWNHTAR